MSPPTPRERFITDLGLMTPAPDADDACRRLLAAYDALLALLVHLRDDYDGGYLCDDDGTQRHRDHACAECWPGGSSVEQGFRCAYHELRAVTAAAPRAASW